MFLKRGYQEFQARGGLGGQGAGFPKKQGGDFSKRCSVVKYKSVSACVSKGYMVEG